MINVYLKADDDIHRIQFRFYKFESTNYWELRGIELMDLTQPAGIY